MYNVQNTFLCSTLSWQHLLFTAEFNVYRHTKCYVRYWMSSTSRGPIMQCVCGSVLIHWTSLRPSWWWCCWQSLQDCPFCGDHPPSPCDSRLIQGDKRKLVIHLDFEWLTYVNHHTALLQNSYPSNHCVWSIPSTSGSSNDSSQFLSSSSGTKTQTGLGQRKGESRHAHQLFRNVVIH